MDEYKKPYLALFNAMLDALEAIRRGAYDEAEALLIRGQQRAEALFIEYGQDEQKDGE